MTRLFFQTQFSNRVFDETRQQILYRIWMVMADPTLSKMFGAQKNAINLFEAMNNGSLILINTAKDLLKQEGSEILGRFFMALIAQATQERAVIPEDKRQPTFVYIDEAQDYFDDTLEGMLISARKYKVGLCIAHQFSLSLSHAFAILVWGIRQLKWLGECLDKKPPYLHGSLAVSRNGLLKQGKTDKETAFVCSIKNRPPPTILHVPLLRMEKGPKISQEAYRGILVSNRRRYCQTLGKIPVSKPAAPVRWLTEPEVI